MNQETADSLLNKTKMDQTNAAKPKTFFKGNSAIDEDDEELQEISKIKSPDYTNKYKIIRNYAPCEFKMAELVDQLDEVDEYEQQLKSSGLILLRTKFLETQPLHKKLLGRILSYNKIFAHHVEIFNNLRVMTAKNKEKQDNMRRKRQVYDALKTLLQKLVYSPEQL